MAGKKGQPHPIKKRTYRHQMWQTMRIKRKEFAAPDLMITVPGVTATNVKKFVMRLTKHGIIREIGNYISGRPGQFKRYRLVTDIGPTLPDICPNCGKRMTETACKGEFGRVP